MFLWLETLLYDLRRPQQVRTQPLQLLCLGLSRSGTDSLRSALIKLNVAPVFHGYEGASRTPPTWQSIVLLGRRKYDSTATPDHGITRADVDEICGDCLAITDMPMVAFSAELIALYPEAKVVLNTRELGAWYASFENTFGRWLYGASRVDEKTLFGRVAARLSWARFWLRCYFCAELYWLGQSMRFHAKRWYNNPKDGHRATGMWRYREHAAMVRGMVEEERLLEWTPRDGWKPLCEFLGVEVPKHEKGEALQFPNGNKPGDFDRRLNEILRGYQKRADRNMVITAAVLSALAVMSIRYAEALFALSSSGLSAFSRP